MMADHDRDRLGVLFDWFTAQGGRFDGESLTFAPIDSLGWAAFALCDLQVPKKKKKYKICVSPVN